MLGILGIRGRHPERMLCLPPSFVDTRPDVSTRLAAFLQRHGTFGARSGPASLRASRGRCWQKLLRLPNHAEAYEAQMQIYADCGC